MPKIVRFHEFGEADVLRIEEVAEQRPGAGEARIRVEAFALNRADVLLRRNQYIEHAELPSRLGYDAAGVVEAVGAGVEAVHVGDRVMTYPTFSPVQHGVYGESAIVPAHSLIAYPHNLTAQQAATVGVQYMTGYFGLYELGRLERDDWVVITAASSSTGVAAIKLAKCVGAKVIATTRNAVKRRPLLDHGADEVVATQEQDIREVVHARTEGKGVKLIYDAVVGPNFEALCDVVAPRGHIVIYGALGGEPRKLPLWPLFGKGASLHFYKVFDFTGSPSLALEPQTSAVERAKAFIVRHLADGALEPVIAKIFPLEQVAEAHRYMESNQQIGKIVVTTDPV